MPGRGKPKGQPKSGGRQQGAVDKIKREAILSAQNITPLDYMMQLVRAETPPGLDPAIAKARETLRFEAAKAAAPTAVRPDPGWARGAACTFFELGDAATSRLRRG
jgi:hypothetical protein